MEIENNAGSTRSDRTPRDRGIQSKVVATSLRCVVKNGVESVARFLVRSDHFLVAGETV
jgi:hypothetical protein